MRHATSKLTTSLCPACLAEIPATVHVVPGQGVFINKTCPVHGASTGIIERDALFYVLFSLSDAGTIYDGLLLDVTSRCNARCKFCYYATDNASKDPPMMDIIQQCRENEHLSPFIFLGGEPTVREDLPELARQVVTIGPVSMVTNGLKLSDPDYVRLLAKSGFADQGVFWVSISLHPEKANTAKEYEAKIRAIENIISEGLKILCLIFVIDDLEQLGEVISVGRKYQGHVLDIRVKLATNISAETGAPCLYNSDAFHWLENRARTEGVVLSWDAARNNAPHYVNAIYDGMSLILIQWPTRYNIDVRALDCPPYYRAKDGRLLNLAHSLILAEGPHAEGSNSRIPSEHRKEGFPHARFQLST